MSPLWVIFLLLTILTWGSYNLFFKALEGQVNYFVIVAVIGLAQVLIALPFIYFSTDVPSSLKNYFLPVVMGLLLAAGTIFFFYTFKFGANASIAIPAYALGALLIGVIGGLVIFNEAIDFRVGIGLVLGLLSIILLITR